MSYGLILGASILLVVGNLGLFGWEFYLHTTKNLSIHRDKLPNNWTKWIVQIYIPLNCLFSNNCILFGNLYPNIWFFVWKFIFEWHKWCIEIFCGVRIKLSSSGGVYFMWTDKNALVWFTDWSQTRVVARGGCRA